jgi:NitT/TauT family transport system substrate-binding protein
MLGERLPPGVRLEPRVFAAGPSLIEALFAGALDLGFVGPTPTLNGHIQSRGRALRVVAGASSGGSVLVVRDGVKIERTQDLRGKTLSTPQLGNTQDVALRTWLSAQGLLPDGNGGDVRVVPLGNAEMFTLFKRGEIDGAWVVEPWAARLERESFGQVLVDERHLRKGGRFVAAHVIARAELLRKEPFLVRAFLQGHVAATRRIRSDPGWVLSLMGAEIERLTRHRMDKEVLSRALSRVEATWDPLPPTLKEGARAAQRAGFTKEVDLRGLYALDLLNDVLNEEGLPEVDAP